MIRVLRRLGRPLTYVVVLLAMIGSGIGFWLVRVEIDELREGQRENLVWAATQLQVEHLRFSDTLDRFVRGVPGVTETDVNLRFDLLWSRLGTLREGQVGTRIDELPEILDRIKVFDAMLREVDDFIVELGPEDREAARAVLAQFAAAEGEVRRIALEAVRAQTDWETRRHLTLVQGSDTLSLLVVMLACGSLALLLFYADDARRERRRAEQTRDLLDAAQQGQRARARFLSMMSHELRTPMNGVLGMIALARQPGLPKGQDMLLDRAASSARAMHGLLSDITDLAANDDRFPAQSADGFPEVTAETVADALRAGLAQDVPVAARESMGGPMRLDLDRLVRAVERVVDQIGSTPDRVSVYHNDDGLDIHVMSAKIDVADPVWSTLPPDDDGFGGSGVEIAIARAFIDQMGGTLRVRNGAVSILIPEPRLQPRQDPASGGFR